MRHDAKLEVRRLGNVTPRSLAWFHPFVPQVGDRVLTTIMRYATRYQVLDRDGRALVTRWVLNRIQYCDVCRRLWGPEVMETMKYQKPETVVCPSCWQKVERMR